MVRGRQGSAGHERARKYCSLLPCYLPHLDADGLRTLERQRLLEDECRLTRVLGNNRVLDMLEVRIENFLSMQEFKVRLHSLFWAALSISHLQTTGSPESVLRKVQGQGMRQIKGYRALALAHELGPRLEFAHPLCARLPHAFHQPSGTTTTRRDKLGHVY